MERNPLYFNTDLGGLVPITNPDLIASNLIDWQTNSTTSLLIALNDPALLASNLNLTPEHILFRAIAYDALAEAYVYATEEIELATIGIVVAVGANNLIVQFCGVIRNTSFPAGNWYLSPTNNGELNTQANRILLVANNVIVKQVEEAMVNQAVITGGLIVTSGLNVAAKAGTKINIGIGTSSKTHTFTTQTLLATMPANSTEKHLYIKEDLSVELLDNPYLIAPNETNEFVLHTGTIDSTSAMTEFIYTAGTSPKLDIRSAGGGIWAMAHFTNTLTNYSNHEYYEITYNGGNTNTQFGVITLDYTKPLPAWNVALSTSSINDRFGDCICLSRQTASSPFIKPASSVSWSLHYSGAVANSGVQVHGILINRITKNVYWSINGTWLNSGQPIASYTGSKAVVPAIAVAHDLFGSTYINDPIATKDTFPPNVLTPYVFYNKTANQAYSVNYTTTPPTPVYEAKLYLGSLTSNNTNATLTSTPPHNNTYTEEINLNEQTTITHNLKTIAPVISYTTEAGVTYKITPASPTINDIMIEPTIPTVNNTIVTVSC